VYKRQDKLIKYTVDKTGLAQAQTKAERKGLTFGRLLVFSSITQAEVFEPRDGFSQNQLEEVINNFFFEIARIFNQQHHFRESALKTIERTFENLKEINPKALAKSVKTLTKYTLFKPTEEFKEQNDAFRYRISTDADYLSLLFVIKKFFPKSLQNDEELQIVSNWSIDEDYKYIFKQLKRIFVQETVVLAFPRSHNVVRYLVEYLSMHKKTKIIKSLWKNVFEQYCFDENQLYKDEINKRAKM